MPQPAVDLRRAILLPDPPLAMLRAASCLGFPEATASRLQSGSRELRPPTARSPLRVPGGPLVEKAPRPAHHRPPSIRLEGSNSPRPFLAPGRPKRCWQGASSATR